MDGGREGRKGGREGERDGGREIDLTWGQVLVEVHES